MCYMLIVLIGFIQFSQHREVTLFEDTTQFVNKLYTQIEQVKINKPTTQKNNYFIQSNLSSFRRLRNFPKNERLNSQKSRRICTQYNQ